MNYIKGKTALITGASSGIGETLAYELAKMGVNLVLVARNERKLKEICQKIRSDFKIICKFVQLDVRDKKNVKKVLAPFAKKIDILINNAGLALGTELFEQASEDDFDVMIDTNIKGLLYVTKVFAQHFKTLETAHIINLGSVAGKFAYTGGNVYCTTKAAVKMLSEALNVDFFGTNVKVSLIAPGAVKTNFSVVRYKGDKQKADAVYKGYEPLVSKDIANLICYILNTPPNVNIQYADIMPTAQRNPFVFDKNN